MAIIMMFRFYNFLYVPLVRCRVLHVIIQARVAPVVWMQTQREHCASAVPDITMTQPPVYVISSVMTVLHVQMWILNVSPATVTVLLVLDSMTTSVLVAKVYQLITSEKKHPEHVTVYQMQPLTLTEIVNAMPALPMMRQPTHALEDSFVQISAQRVMRYPKIVSILVHRDYRSIS